MTRARATPVGFRACVGLVLGVLLASGCQSESESRSAVPEGFDVPKGVHVTPGGARRSLGRPVTVVYQIEQRAASAITVTVTEIEAGDLGRDFQFFNLSEEARSARPLYVHVHVRNDGPSGLGGVALPIYLRTTADHVLPPNDLVGDFSPCPNPTLPASFLPGAQADVCVVFLVPRGEKATSMDIQTGEPRDAIHVLVERGA